MTYDNDSHITSVEEVESFFDYLLEERKIIFHPDDSFGDYINYETKEPIFTKEEVILFDRLMDESFDVFEKRGVDIYQIGIDKLRSPLGITRIINDKANSV